MFALYRIEFRKQEALRYFRYALSVQQECSRNCLTVMTEDANFTIVTNIPLLPQL